MVKVKRLTCYLWVGILLRRSKPKHLLVGPQVVLKVENLLADLF